MADPVDMIMPMLREMRAEMRDEFDAVKGLIGVLDKRMSAIEANQKSYRAALSADTLMTKLITGEFEERIEALEVKVRELESHK
jgi:polyhydroxyalkanoate synthesis regulator phasin